MDPPPLFRQGQGRRVKGRVLPARTENPDHPDCRRYSQNGPANAGDPPDGVLLLRDDQIRRRGDHPRTGGGSLRSGQHLHPG